MGQITGSDGIFNSTNLLTTLLWVLERVLVFDTSGSGDHPLPGAGHVCVCDCFRWALWEQHVRTVRRVDTGPPVAPVMSTEDVCTHLYWCPE